jgi:hypothetical protein
LFLFSPPSRFFSFNHIGAFVLFGKVFGNRMVDVRVSNNKLYFRAISIVAEIAKVDQNVARENLWKAIYRTDSLTGKEEEVSDSGLDFFFRFFFSSSKDTHFGPYFRSFGARSNCSRGSFVGEANRNLSRSGS